MLGKCTKIINNVLKQVHMAPFGLILGQNPSHRIWDASGMPPGPWGAQGKGAKICPPPLNKNMKVGLWCTIIG